MRLHYVYPYPHVDEVIPLMAEGKILPYLDIPFQHASPKVLRAMKRPAAQEKTLERIRKWREMVPDLAIRSTFIVGFPGETDADFEELLQWLEEARLDRVGCFRFEPVAGAPANALPDPVPAEVTEQRWHRLMKAQQAISVRNLKKKVGQRVPVIVDEANGRTGRGRTKWDAPEIDGGIHLTGRLPIRAGEIVTARVTGSSEYDLTGEIA